MDNNQWARFYIAFAPHKLHFAQKIHWYAQYSFHFLISLFECFTCWRNKSFGVVPLKQNFYLLDMKLFAKEWMKHHLNMQEEKGRLLCCKKRKKGSNRVPLSTLSNGKSYIIFCIDFSFCYLSLSKTHTVVLLFLKMQVLLIILQFPVVFISVATKGVQREQGPSCDPLHPLFLQL